MQEPLNGVLGDNQQMGCRCLQSAPKEQQQKIAKNVIHSNNLKHIPKHNEQEKSSNTTLHSFLPPRLLGGGKRENVRAVEESYAKWRYSYSRNESSLFRWALPQRELGPDKPSSRRAPLHEPHSWRGILYQKFIGSRLPKMCFTQCQRPIRKGTWWCDARMVLESFKDLSIDGETRAQDIYHIFLKQTGLKVQ